MAGFAALFLLLGFVALLACIVAAFRPFAIGKFQLLNSRKNALIGIPVIIVTSFTALMIVGALEVAAHPEKYPATPATSAKTTIPAAESKTSSSSASSTPVPPPAKSLKEANANITEVSNEGDIVTAKVFIKTAWDEANYIDLVGLYTADIGKAVQAGAAESKDAEWVKVVYSSPMRDRLGNESTDTFLTLTFPASDFREANWKNLYGPETINLATNISFTPAGRSSSIKWCAKNESQALVFCNTALGG